MNNRFARSHILALDIGTLGVNAVIFTRNQKSIRGNAAVENHILKILRYPIFLFKSGAITEKTGQNERLPRILKNIFLKIFKETRSVSKHLDKILVSVADPFFVDAVIDKKISRLRPGSAISFPELAGAIRDLTAEAASMQKNLVLVGYELLGARVNGYSVENALGYKGKSLEVTTISTFISGALKEYIDLAQKTFFSNVEICYYSDARVLWKMLKKSENLSDPVVAIHINGEMTGIFNFHSGSLNCAGAYALGARTLERRLAIFLKKDILEAESILRRYSDGNLEESAKKEVERVLSTALADWETEFAKSMEYFRFRNLPMKIFLSGPGSDFKIFTDLINNYFKNSFNKEADVQNLTAQGLKDFINPPTALYGGKDALLASLMFLN